MADASFGDLLKKKNSMAGASVYVTVVKPSTVGNSKVQVVFSTGPKTPPCGTLDLKHPKF